MAKPKSRQSPLGLAKAQTGITGLDEITNGGFPQGRPTLICGGPGCGKSLMGIEFLIRGATAAGFAYHLTKPVDFVKLEKVIDTVVSAR